MRTYRTDEQPVLFNRYMFYLEKGMRREGDYRKLNTSLIKQWIKTKNDAEKKEIRNRIVTLNLRIAHEILYRTLNPDTRRNDTQDIFQDVNILLIEAVDSFFNSEEENYLFAKFIWNYIKNRLEKIKKFYYDWKTEEFFENGIEDPSFRKFEESDNLDHLIRLGNNYLKGHEGYILQESFKNNIDPETIGDRIGLTTERVRYLKDKGLKRFKDILLLGADRTREYNNFRKELKRLMIIEKVSYCYVARNIRGEDNLFLKDLIQRGMINPNNCLIVMEETGVYNGSPLLALLKMALVKRIPKSYETSKIIDLNLEDVNISNLGYLSKGIQKDLLSFYSDYSQDPERYKTFFLKEGEYEYFLQLSELRNIDKFSKLSEKELERKRSSIIAGLDKEICELIYRRELAKREDIKFLSFFLSIVY